MKIAASFLSCKKIRPAIEKLSFTDIDYLHVDVIDGKFIEGKKIPLRQLKKIYRWTSKRLDVHLMVRKPKKYIKTFASLNTERIIIHIELEKNIEKNLAFIRSFGIKCGLAINPKTEISMLKPYLDKIDTILVMSVEPGYGGQAFIQESIDRLSKIKKMVKESKKMIEIAIDGGINDDNCQQLTVADTIVVGSYITSSSNYQEQIDKLKIK